MCGCLTLFSPRPTLPVELLVEGVEVEARSVEICVNDQSRELDSGTTVAQLLAQLNLESRYLAVERNLQIVPRREHARCILQPGDRLEIVTLVGGG